MIRLIVPDSHGAHIDASAGRAFLADAAKLNPQQVVLIGDHIDAGGTFSAHQRNYTHEMTESYDSDVRMCNWFLDALQRACPRAEFHYLEGNHEQHVERWASREFERKVDADMFLERMGPTAVLHLKDRGIRYYKASEMYMGLASPGTIRLGKCYFTHGWNHGTHATYSHLQRAGDNIVHGHTHRSSAVLSRTLTKGAIGAWCPGTLAKLQPLYRHTSPTQWTHGYGVQFVNKSGLFAHVNIPIFDGKTSLTAMTGELGGGE